MHKYKILNHFIKTLTLSNAVRVINIPTFSQLRICRPPPPSPPLRKGQGAKCFLHSFQNILRRKKKNVEIILKIFENRKKKLIFFSFNFKKKCGYVPDDFKNFFL